MVHFTLNADRLPEKDIYIVEKAEARTVFPKPGRSLCLVHEPVWTSGGRELLRVSGRKRNGEPDTIYLAEGGNGIDQGYHRCLLGKTLDSPFLFASWKKSGCHQVSIVQKGHAPIWFNSFDDALNAYLPEGFTPAYSFRRKSVFVLMFLALERRRRFAELLSVLERHLENLRANE